MKKKILNKILYMGCYREPFHRVTVPLSGLRKNKIKLYEYNVNSHNLLKNLRSFLKNFKKLKNYNADLILLHSEAFIQFILAKLLSFVKGVPLVHDIYISKLQTIYDDREQFEKRRIPKILLRIILFTMDLIECTFSDQLLLDTNAHIKFFHDKYKTPIKKFRRLYVGAMDDIFYPRKRIREKDYKYIVGFIGTFIPLQGVEYIIQAAKILEKNKEIVFYLIGNGQTFNKCKELADNLKLKNVIFYGLIPMENVSQMISTFDIKLCIFGNTYKAQQVIPTKAFDGMAMKKPMISMDSPGIRELFTNNEDIVLCERANPESLAEAILKLKNDKNLREKIGENAYKLYQKFCSPDAVGKKLIQILTNLLN